MPNIFLYYMYFLYVWDTAAMGASFAFTETVVANQRQKNDPLNGVAGGCAAGFLAGIRGVLESAVPATIRASFCLCNLSSFSTNGGRGMRSRWGGSRRIRLLGAIGRSDDKPRKEGGETQTVFQTVTATANRVNRVTIAMIDPAIANCR